MTTDYKLNWALKLGFWMSLLDVIFIVAIPFLVSTTTRAHLQFLPGMFLLFLDIGLVLRNVWFLPVGATACILVVGVVAMALSRRSAAT
jgi:NADH:ubiquinone oxidoreductase subunit 6 (subunit J)